MDTFFGHSLASGDTGSKSMSGSYELRGTVIDEATGNPVEGVLVRLGTGKNTVDLYSDQMGVLFLREKKQITMPITVDIANGTQVGQWEIVSVPTDTSQPLHVVLKRVSSKT